MKLALLLVALLGCTNRANTMIGSPVRLTALKPPHEPIYVETRRGLARVYLDTGDVDLLGPPREAGETDTVVIDDTTAISIRNGRYHVRRGPVTREVPEVVPYGRPSLSPDRKLFAVAPSPHDVRLDGREDVAVVSIADLSVRRFPLTQRTQRIDWSPDSSELWLVLGSDGMRIVLATGERGPLDLDEARRRREAMPGSETCAARGIRLEVQHASDRQRIIVVRIASEDPERLSAIEPRVLVSATHHDWSPHSHGWPVMLEDAFFTTSCDHFVFRFGDRVYVGEVATGRFAYLTTGESASPTRP